ncbi:hypothetical protein D9619_013648 [Psilocybe cf. subviscida]|uniref:Uncharacterized protein n=1 Tax=Psilocybe cf. subviscida TaxID=2480587 RepID=A0A8H5BR88_9AGAR|nr:hypothetical protein D9619_013648 [Psilocybe cf. subviscida]
MTNVKTPPWCLRDTTPPSDYRALQRTEIQEYLLCCLDCFRPSLLRTGQLGRHGEGYGASSPTLASMISTILNAIPTAPDRSWDAACTCSYARNNPDPLNDRP